MLPRARPTDTSLFGMLLAVLLVPLTPDSASGQSAAEILQATADRYEERMSGIENYTIVQDVMGFAATTYYERGEDGTFTLSSLEGSSAVQRIPVVDRAHMSRVAEVSTYEGEQEVGGRSAHVIFVEDIETPSQPGFEDGTVRMWIDEEWLVPLQVRMEGTVTVDGKSGPVTSTVVFEDYHDEQGLFHPYTTRITTEGVSELMDVSEEQMEEMMRGMEQLQEQLKSMPAAQRAMMERMMGGQLELVQQMLSSGAMDLVVQVTEVRVNAGPPDG